MCYANAYQLSYDSKEKLKQTTDLLHSIRRLAELFTRCLDGCDKQNEEEARIAAIDFLDPLLHALADSIDYLHGSSAGMELVDCFDKQV